MLSAENLILERLMWPLAALKRFFVPASPQSKAILKRARHK
jgi:hypothetical protein